MTSIFSKAAFYTPENGEIFVSAVSKELEGADRELAVSLDSFCNWVFSVLQMLPEFDPLSIGRSKVVKNTRGNFQAVVFGFTKKGGERFTLVIEHPPKGEAVSLTLDGRPVANMTTRDPGILTNGIRKSMLSPVEQPHD